MKTIKIIFLLIVLVSALFLAGCASEQPKQPVQQPQPAPVREKPVLEINSEKNITTGPNRNNDTGNHSMSPKPVKTGINYTLSETDRFAVYFIAVGDDRTQGDSILVKKGDMDVLIDAGTKKNSNKVIDFLNLRGADDIDLMISTHADAAEYGGMEDVMKAFNVEEFWWGGKDYNDENYRNLVQSVKDEGIPQKIVSRGDLFTLNGLDFQIVHPQLSDTTGVYGSAMAIKITQNKFCILLTSDIIFSAQSDIVNKVNVKCDIMQLPYHGLGLGTNNIDTFLLKVAPKAVIVSGGTQDELVGKVGSRFTVFEKLRLKDISRYENYYNGTVRVTSDGISYAIDYVQ